MSNEEDQLKKLAIIALLHKLCDIAILKNQNNYVKCDFKKLIIRTIGKKPNP
jgi:hypothetical protein